MTKIEETKGMLGFRDEAPRCGNCKHFTSEVQKRTGWDGTSEYPVEKNLRCSVGDFTVKKMAWCNKHEWRKA